MEIPEDHPVYKSRECQLQRSKDERNGKCALCGKNDNTVSYRGCSKVADKIITKPMVRDAQNLHKLQKTGMHLCRVIICR